MRKAAIGIVAIATMIGTPALAADMALKAPPPAAVPTWTGWYIGANAGWLGAARGNQQLTGTDTDDGGLGFLLREGFIPAGFNVRPHGVIGGGQIGYNWQVANWLFGFEADFDGSTLKGTQTLLGLTPGITDDYSQTLTSELDWLATVRGRVGVTWAQVLLYATGGLAVGQTKIGFSAVDLILPIPPLNATSSADTTRAGWALGGGLEWKFAPQWSVKAEYLYVDLGHETATVPYAYVLFTTGAANNSTLTAQIKEQYRIVRGGLNYRF